MKHEPIEQDESTVTTVVFRKWTATGTILALFPNMAWNVSGTLCGSYEHVGQHGGAHYASCLVMTEPATPTEYQSLFDELTSLGYRLYVKEA